MEIIYLIIGLAIGAACVYFIMQSRLNAANNQLQSADNACKSQLQQAASQLEQTKQTMAALLDAERQKSQQLLQQEKEQSAKLLQHEQTKCAQLIEQEQSKSQQMIEQEKMKSTEMMEMAKKDADQQFNLLKAQFTALSEELLRQRSTELQQTNRTHMETLFNPLKENLARMEQAMKDSELNAARNTSSLKASMEQMMQQTLELGKEADRLSNALQQNNKITGNWGELILTELLESQGLQKGVHFDVQETLRDEQGAALRNEDTGSKMIPDVILHLADNRDVIIDSKMSLKAFTDYQNTEDKAEKDSAADRHLESVRNHVKELAVKNYSKYIPKNHSQIDFVIMFVPIEGALQLALAHEPELWREAFEKKVFIAGAQTLIAALRIIDLTWVTVQQERNTQKITEEARKLIDRVNTFIIKFKTMGTKLDDAKKVYDEVTNIVSDGKQTILGAGRKLENLGVRGKKPLPKLDDEDTVAEPTNLGLSGYSIQNE
ncbi:MAG: DNA recombination protein RmuC [Bacteroidales bacterium]|nr:DNA recombination protein RmuC [Bacteroidales bacterium]